MTVSQDQVSPTITIVIGVLMCVGAVALLASGYVWPALPVAVLGLGITIRSWAERRGWHASRRLSQVLVSVSVVGLAVLVLIRFA